MQSVHLQIKRLPGNDDLPLPQYMSTHAAGMDVCAAVTEDVTLAPNTVVLIPTGLTMAIDPGYEIQVRPRSGLALKHGITLVNAPGTIDADYRGEVGVILGNIGQEEFTVTRGMRIAQLVIQEVVQAVVVEVDALSSTERGEGGFGSSGTH
ncbi:MAG: dUTP diphosphatase [Planctomycetota bacterium]|jgi:dUTP pyrophosphatase